MNILYFTLRFEKLIIKAKKEWSARLRPRLHIRVQFLSPSSIFITSERKLFVILWIVKKKEFIFSLRHTSHIDEHNRKEIFFPISQCKRTFPKQNREKNRARPIFRHRTTCGMSTVKSFLVTQRPAVRRDRPRAGNWIPTLQWLKWSFFATELRPQFTLDFYQNILTLWLFTTRAPRLGKKPGSLYL